MRLCLIVWPMRDRRTHSSVPVDVYFGEFGASQRSQPFHELSGMIPCDRALWPSRDSGVVHASSENGKAAVVCAVGRPCVA